MSASTVVGVSLAVVGCIIQAVGFMVQKVGHNKLEIENNNRDIDDHRTYLSSGIWIIGFILNAIIGTLFNIIALNFAPQSLVLPISAVTLVGNTILAVLILKEPFHLFDFIGTVLVILGALFAIIYGPRQGPRDITIDYLLDRWNDTAFLSFFWIVSCAYIIDIIYVKYLENNIQKHNEKVTQLHMDRRTSISDDNIDDLNGNFNHTLGSTLPIFDIRQLSQSVYQEDVNELREVVGVNNLLNYSDYNVFLVSYASLSGFCAAISFLFVKSTMELVTSAFKTKELSKSNFGSQQSWYTYMMILLLIIVNILLLYFQQRALSLFNSLYVIPIFQVTVIILGTSLGALFFDELEDMPARNFTIFVMSVLVTVLGVVVLALVPKNKIEYRNLKKSNRLSQVYDSGFGYQGIGLNTNIEDNKFNKNRDTISNSGDNITTNITNTPNESNNLINLSEYSSNND